MNRITRRRDGVLSRWVVAVVTVVAVAVAVAGCSGGSGDAESSRVKPEEPGTTTCALCAMVVREQPASRAQVVHRDGKRVFLCSVSELPHYVAAPSPNGKPVAVWVEALRVEDGASARSVEPRPWIAVDSAHFVVGGPSRPVMGESVLPYATASAADSVADECGGTVLSWAALTERLAGDAP